MKAFLATVFMSFPLSSLADSAAAVCDRPSTEMRVYVMANLNFQYDCASCYVRVDGQTIQINKIEVVDRQTDNTAKTIQIDDPANPGFHLIYDADTFLRAIDDKTGALLAITSCPIMTI